MTDYAAKRMAFKNAFIEHFRSERDRAEKCIADLIDILSERDSTDEQHVAAILDRIIQHYDRRKH